MFSMLEIGEHSVSELARIVGLSNPRTRAIVSDLVSKGKLEAVGANKNRKGEV